MARHTNISRPLRAMLAAAVLFAGSSGQAVARLMVTNNNPTPSDNVAQKLQTYKENQPEQTLTFETPLADDIISHVTVGPGTKNPANYSREQLQELTKVASTPTLIILSGADLKYLTA